MNQGIGKNELCRRAGFNFNQLQRLETAFNNFKMELVFKYLNSIGHCIYLQSTRPERLSKIECYDDLFNWVQNKRKESNLTVAAFAEMTGFSPASISNIDNKRQVITVDLFLAMCEAFNFNIQIKSK